MMRKLLVTISLLSCFIGFTQQEQQFTQYMVNPYTLNPALGGTEDFVDVRIGYRKQWAGLEGAPRSYYLTGHTTLGKEFNLNTYHHKGEHQNWHGVGGYVYSDKTGPISRSAFYFQYAYNMALNKKVRLSMGAFIGVKQFSYDISGLRKEDENDLALQTENFIKVNPDLNLGIWLYSNDWYLGFSVFQLLQNEITVNSESQGENGNLNMHFFGTGGVKIKATDEVSVVPSFAVKGVYGAPISIDINAKIDYKDLYYGGLSLRGGDALAALVGVVISKKVEVSYSYDFTLSSLNKVSNGSHELVIGIRIKHPKHVICASKYW